MFVCIQIQLLMPVFALPAGKLRWNLRAEGFFFSAGSAVDSVVHATSQQNHTFTSVTMICELGVLIQLNPPKRLYI